MFLLFKYLSFHENKGHFTQCLKKEVIPLEFQFRIELIIPIWEGNKMIFLGLVFLILNLLIAKYSVASL